jgi:hypothetical protein
MSTLIDINDDHELYIWSRLLHITPDELVRLASEVGPSAEQIRDAIKRAQIVRSGGKGPPGGQE